MKSGKFKHLLAALLLCSSAVATLPAFAHGAAPARHGGVVQTASDMSFELVPAADGAALYVVDHEADYNVKQMGGKLTVLNGAEKTEAELKPAGGNKLEAKGVKLGKGAKAVATVTEGRKTTTVRFTIK
ncbi:hypothetical protein V9L20_22145 [Variovorax sp. CCNWLW225]|jgi:hypothetical protein|uniref:hypothetical protein n=1 Tax=Variovorax sp. CCNWLW225 TaxID=3127462 RepID=UPI00307820DB